MSKFAVTLLKQGKPAGRVIYVRADTPAAARAAVEKNAKAIDEDVTKVTLVER